MTIEYILYPALSIILHYLIDLLTYMTFVSCITGIIYFYIALYCNTYLLCIACKLPKCYMTCMTCTTYMNYMTCMTCMSMTCMSCMTCITYMNYMTCLTCLTCMTCMTRTALIVMIPGVVWWIFYRSYNHPRVELGNPSLWQKAPPYKHNIRLLYTKNIH